MRFAIHSRRRTDGALLLALVGLLLVPGCVTRSAHNEVVGDLEIERDGLKRKVQNLERSNQSLDAERAKLLETMEDLRLERETLSRDIAKLEKTKSLLSEHLRERDEQVAELSKLETTYRGLVNDLESEVATGEIQIEQLREGIRLNLSQNILFRSGQASLERSGVDVLKKVSDQLQNNSHTIDVQGHTDNVPLRGSLASRWGSNWELAAARAASVVRLFQKLGIGPDRLTVVSRGEFAPVSSNDSPEGRARNRRIEIRLRPVEEPVASGARGQVPEAPPDTAS